MTMHEPSQDLRTRRVHLFTGKGGVGKSTVVAAMAVALARTGRRPLVVELGHRASMESIFGGHAIGYEPTEVSEGVWATNMDTAAAVADYIGHHLRVQALARVALRSRTLRRFFEAAPGVAEVATLHRLQSLLDASGEAPFDPVLVDLDATGHARMFFELPKVFADIAESGPLRRLLDGISALLRDASTTALHVVTLPAELPVQETLELYRDLHADALVELGALVVNMVPEPPLDEADVARMERERSREPALHVADLALAARAVERHRRAERLIAVLRVEVDRPLVRLPLVPGFDGSLEALGRMGASLLDGMSRRQAAEGA